MQDLKYRYPIFFSRKFYAGLVLGLVIYFVLAQIIFNPFGIRRLLTDNRTFVLSRVEEHLQIPEGQKGSLFEVADASKLKNINETLFSNVKDGDQLVIYGDIAVIYNQKEDKIVNIVNLSKKEATLN